MVVAGPVVGSLVDSLITVLIADGAREPLPLSEKLATATGREAAALIAGPNAASLGSPPFVPALATHF